MKTNSERVLERSDYSVIVELKDIKYNLPDSIKKQVNANRNHCSAC